MNEDEIRAAIRLTSLCTSINRAFSQSDPVALRKWYVQTFVLDPFNLPQLKMLPEMPLALAMLWHNQQWQTTEHAAIGTRLVYEMNPWYVWKTAPTHFDLSQWKTETGIARNIMLLFKPWESLRFDPEGENWFSLATPGQWRRHGKGKPGENEAEERIYNWLRDLDPATLEWAPEPPEGMSIDEMADLPLLCRAAYSKFAYSQSALRRIREVMERSSLMHLSTVSLNQNRDFAPFANGVVSLVAKKFLSTTGDEARLSIGDLLPMSPEYMVTNANPLTWLDTQGNIAAAYEHMQDTDGDDFAMDEYEDDLWRQAPTFLSFLTHAFPDDAIEERLAFLRLLGAAMYGSNMKILAAMIGEPNAGKDTVIKWLEFVMPGQVAALPFSAFTPHGDEDRGFAPLLGKRVAVVSGEVGEGRGSKLMAEKLKIVSSGGGTLRVAEKYEKPSTIFFDGMLFLQGNSVPTISGGDKALMENRLVAVEFKHPFTLKSVSFDAEYKTEAPYFAQILFMYFLRYLRKGGGMDGIDAPLSWRNFKKTFADASNQHGFLEACIVKTDTPTPTHQFHAALTAMVAKFGSPYPVSANYWPKRLKSMGMRLDDPTVRRQVMKDGVRSLSYYLTIDADKSDGAFTQRHWEQCLQDAAVTS